MEDDRVDVELSVGAKDYYLRIDSEMGVAVWGAHEPGTGLSDQDVTSLVEMTSALSQDWPEGVPPDDLTDATHRFGLLLSEAPRNLLIPTEAYMSCTTLTRPYITTLTRPYIMTLAAMVLSAEMSISMPTMTFCTGETSADDERPVPATARRVMAQSRPNGRTTSSAAMGVLALVVYLTATIGLFLLYWNFPIYLQAVLLVPAGLGFVAVLAESRVRPARATVLAVVALVVLLAMFQVTAVLAS